MIQFRGTAQMTKKYGVVIDMPAGRGHGDRGIVKWRPVNPLDVKKGQAMKIRGRLVQKDIDGVTMTVIVMVDGTEIQIIPMVVPKKRK